MADLQNDGVTPVRGMMVTTGRISGDALSLALKHGIQCVAGDDLNLILDSINKTVSTIPLNWNKREVTQGKSPPACHRGWPEIWRLTSWCISVKFTTKLKRQQLKQSILKVRTFVSKFCKSKADPEEATRLKTLYFDTALQYQIAARFATIVGMSPVAGNLFHHAIEMYLKGALCKVLDEAQRRRLGHDLKRIWRRYKRQNPDPVLTKFNRTISDLHNFERIRYPEDIIYRGMESVIGFVREPGFAGTGPIARYQLVVDELDELVQFLFTAASANPRAYVDRRRPDALKYLRDQSKFPL
jgi:hypothetical protein